MLLSGCVSNVSRGPRSVARTLLAILLAGALPWTASCGGDPEVQKAKAFERGEQYFADARFAEAIVEYRRALQLDPQMGRARFKLAEAYAATKDLKSAYPEYVRARDLLKDDLDVQIQAGNMLLLGRRFQEAKDTARTILQKEPDNLQGLLLLGNALAGLRDLDNAIAVTRRASEVQPDRAGVYANLGVLQLARGDQAEAEQAFAKAVEKNPNDPAPLISQANFYRAINNFGAAERSLKRAIEIAPQHPRANRALAAHYLFTNRPDLAEPFLKQLADSGQDVRAQLDLADFYLDTRRFDEARTVLKALIERTPGFEPESRMALVEHAAGRTAEAHEVIAEFLKKEPNHSGALALRARLLLRERRLDDALRLARRAAQVDAQLPEAHYALALAHLARNDQEEARKSFAEVLALDPMATGAKLELAKLHANRGELDTAITYAQDSVDTEPDSLEARLTLAKTLMVRPDDRPKAQAIIGQLLETYPSSPAVHTALASYHLANEDRPRARAQFDRALQLDARHLDALTGVMAMDLADKAPRRAWDRLYPLLKQHPRDPELTLVAAKFAIAVGDTPAAEQYLRRAMAISPANMEPYTLLGRLFVSQRRLEDASREFAEVIRLDPTSVSGHTMMGMLLHAQKDLKGAVYHYQKAVDIDPGAAAAANNLAWLYAESDMKLDAALQLAQMARNKLPNSPEITDTLGWVYYKKQMLPLAITAFEQSIERDARNPLYHYHLGLAHAQAGDDAKARVALQQALKLAPNFARAEDARRVLATLVY
jgi:tetratricopeptide (TPR) repeat protein